MNSEVSCLVEKLGCDKNLFAQKRALALVNGPFDDP